MKQITLTQGKFTLVDDDVYESIGHLKWNALRVRDSFYASRTSSIKDDPDKKQHTILMHHCVVGYPLNNNEVDHIDGDSLNNQRSNLRIGTGRQNQSNRINPRKGHLVGTTWHKRDSVWSSEIEINGKRKYLGSFKTEQEAHEAYLKVLELV